MSEGVLYLNLDGYTRNGGDTSVIRVVYHGDSFWLSMQDLFEIVKSYPEYWTMTYPLRATPKILSRILNIKSDDFVLPYRVLRPNDTKIPTSTTFIVQRHAGEFLRMSGLNDEFKDRVCGDIISSLAHIQSRQLSVVEVGNKDTTQGDPLSFRMAAMESEIHRQHKKIASLERDVASLTSSLRSWAGQSNVMWKRIESLENDIAKTNQHLSARPSYETSEELRRQANKLYARCKQLESEGR